MSHPDPALVDVRTFADHPLVSNGATSRLRFDEAAFLILFTPGIARENFFLEMTELRRSGRTLTPEEMTAF